MPMSKLLEGPPRRTLAIAFVLALLVAVLDNVTGIEVSFSIFYFVPVGIAAWFVGLRAGLAFALACSVAWFLNDSVFGGHHYSHPLIPYWNALMRGGIFAILAVMASRVREAMKRGDRAFQHLEIAFDELDRARREQLVVKDRLLSHVSHELRTPLTALHQFLTILRDGIAGDLNEEQREYVGIALRNADQLRRMVGDLLESTRAETGKLGLEIASVDVAALVRDLVRTLRSPAAEAGVEIVDAVPEGLPRAQADPARVRQVLVNLLDNALKFTPGPGTVTVTARVHPEMSRRLAVSVTDTGRGIKPEALQQIFTRLHQEDEATDAGRKGLGLGLYISRELVTRQGGRMWAESELDKGTTITFTLPVSEEPGGADAKDDPSRRG